MNREQRFEVADADDPSLGPRATSKRGDEKSETRYSAQDVSAL
ncbi:MAG TPA: hypothetical protein VGG76_08280 [Gemmatimonadaceae bacterium]